MPTDVNGEMVTETYADIFFATDISNIWVQLVTNNLRIDLGIIVHRQQWTNLTARENIFNSI